MSEDPRNAWVRAITNHLGIAGQNQTEYELEPFCLAADESCDIAALCTDRALSNGFYAGGRVSAVSIRTLRRVLSKYPNDVSARAELLAFYGYRCERANVLGFDPEFERVFVSQMLWYITYAPGAEALQVVRVPYLTAAARSLLKRTLADQGAKFGGSALAANISKLSESLLNWSDPEKRKRRLRRSKFPRRESSPGALDEIAVVSSTVVKVRSHPASEYSLSEWANESRMDSAELAGVYQWFGPKTIEHLNEMLDDDSIDFYNRAKILGYCKGARKDNLALRTMYAKHLHWLIVNVPSCKFLSEIYWKDFKTDKQLGPTTRALWLKAVKVHPSAESYINAALAHFDVDAAKTASLLRRAIQLDPNNLMAKSILRKINSQLKATSRHAQLHVPQGFVAGCKSDAITQASKQIQLTDCWLLGSDLPDRTIWTCERIVRNVPNELAVRAELLGHYFHFTYCFAIEGRDPKDSAAHVPHVLWFIENMPETIGTMGVVEDHRDAVGHQLVLAAWKQQIKAYETNAAIAYNASWIFSSHRESFQDGIRMLKQALKVHPKDERLKRRLRHLKGMATRFS